MLSVVKVAARIESGSDFLGWTNGMDPCKIQTVLGRILAKLVGSLEMTRSWLTGPKCRGLTYAVAEGQELCLDLYLPFWKSNCPLVVYLHGGGWNSGSYQESGVSWLTGHGFAVASVQYRFSSEAKFPAQLHDVKEALAWLRAQSREFGFDAEQVALVGVSSGGHLAMLAGLVAQESAQVAAVVNYFGATDFILRSETQPRATEPPGSVVHRLLGSSVKENPDLAREASPVSYVGESSPPLFVIHGARDAQVKVDQAYRIAERYRECGREVELEVLPESGHGGPEFFEKELRLRVVEFLQRHLNRGKGS